jgi:hypothetical protein
MAPIRAGTIGTVAGCQIGGEGSGYRRLQGSQADTNPSLQMAGAGAQHDTRLMPVGAHRLDDVVIGAIQIDENVVSIAVTGKG